MDGWMDGWIVTNNNTIVSCCTHTHTHTLSLSLSLCYYYYYYYIGLQLATERTKKLVRCGRLAASLLHDVAGCYDAYGQALVRAKTALQQNNNNNTTIQALSVLETVATSHQTHGIQTRQQTTKPLHNALQSMGETVTQIYSRYNQTAQTKPRALALRARSKYVKAVQDAQQLWSDGNVQQEVLLDGDKQESRLREAIANKQVEAALLQKLKEVRVLQDKYVGLVKEENRRSAQSSVMESMALESLQLLEWVRTGYCWMQ